MLAVITTRRERFAPTSRDAFPLLHALGKGLQLGPRLRQPRVRIPPTGRGEQVARADPREPLLQARVLVLDLLEGGEGELAFAGTPDGSREVGRVDTDAMGAFWIALDPGDHLVAALVGGNLLPRGNPVPATVGPARVTNVTIALDRGIR